MRGILCIRTILGRYRDLLRGRLNGWKGGEVQEEVAGVEIAMHDAQLVHFLERV